MSYDLQGFRMIARTLGPGKAHLWTEAFMDPNPFMMRSLCGMFVDEHDLRKRSDAEKCQHCERRLKSLPREGTSE